MDAEGDVARLVNLRGVWKIRGSLDGLVLLTSGPNDDDSHAAIRVMDLATGRTIASRPRPADAVRRLVTWFGFGRATRSGALKVIRISIMIPSYVMTCEVLRLGHGASRWRQAMTPPTKLCRATCDCSDGVLVNGILHFASMCRDDILCFDLETEEWTTIHGPSGIPSPWEKIGLAELSGALSIAHTKRRTVDLWLLTGMKKDVWVKVYTIPVAVGRAVHLVPLRMMCPSRNLLFYYRRDYGSATVLQVYDPSSGKCRDVGKAQTNINGRIGLCGSHLDPRLCG
jgi:F-box interacting protein